MQRKVRNELQEQNLPKKDEVEKAFENEYGTFLRFKTLTLVPIDLDLVDTGYMNEEDLERLNNYHKMVREELMPLMSDDRERELLERYTRAIGH